MIDHKDLERTEQAAAEPQPHGGSDTTHENPAPEGTLPQPQAELNPVNGQQAHSARHVEAGRKGAHRVHQLIQQGKLYEQEHGLKSGRQRLRQLIQEGKLYEQEHGLTGGSARRRVRRRRQSREQVLLTFFQTMLRMARPAFRARLLEVVEALKVEQN